MGTTASAYICAPDLEPEPTEHEDESEGEEEQSKKKHTHDRFNRPPLAQLTEYVQDDVRHKGAPLQGYTFWIEDAVKQLTVDFDELTAEDVQEIERLKQAVLELAMDVDQQSAMMVEELGHIWIRTPEFFIQSNLINSTMPRAFSMKVPKPQIDLNLPPGIILDHIDNVYTKAVVDHDGFATLELLAICSNKHTPQLAMNLIASKVLHGAQSRKKMDEDMLQDHLVDERGYGRNPMTANWPDVKRPAPNAKAYLVMMSELVSGRVARESFSDLVFDLQETYYKQETEKRKREADWQLESAPSQDQQLFPTAGAQTEEQRQRAEKRRQNAIKELVEFDENFEAFEKKMPMPHITVLITQTLLRVCQVGCDEVRTEEEICMAEAGHVDQFLRVQAARRIGELAMGGNRIALEVMVAKVMLSPHWLIKEAACKSAIHMIGTLHTTDAMWQAIVLLFSRILFSDREEGTGKKVQSSVKDMVAGGMELWPDTHAVRAMENWRNWVIENPLPSSHAVLTELDEVFRETHSKAKFQAQAHTSKRHISHKTEMKSLRDQLKLRSQQRNEV